MTPRRLIDTLWLTCFWAAGLLILCVLTAIVGYLIYRGAPALSLEFLVSSPRGFPLGTEGGVWPAIKGTAFLVIIATICSAIPGVLTAVYLAVYAGKTRFSQLVNLVVQCMAGIPSIVTGLFVYAVLVVQAGLGISLLAGGVALGIMVFPVIVITSREALIAAARRYRLVGEALGVSPSYMLLRVHFRQAAPAIFGGVLLAMGYAAGATAPIMVTAAVVSARSSGALGEPVMALPYHLYILFSHRISLDNAYGTALLLVLMLLALNVVGLRLRGRLR